MLKITVTCFALVSVLFLGKTLNYADQPKQRSSGTLTGTLQKMIVENGSVTMNVDLNGLNGSNDLTARPAALQFAAATNSFFRFSFLTTCCAVPNRAQSRWFRKADQFHCFPPRWLDHLSTSWSRNFHPAQASTLS